MTSLRPGGSTRAWRRVRLVVLIRDGWRCQVPVDGRPCLLPATHVDHVLPRALGGTDDPANLRAACEPHNLRKGARLDVDVTPPRAPRRPRRPPDAQAPRGRAWDW